MTEKQSTEVRREQIIQAVMEIMAIDGLEGVTAKRVADAVGLAPSALYRHYKGKHEIINAVLDMLGEYQRENVARAMAEDDPLDGIKSMLDGMADLFRVNRSLPLLFNSKEVWKKGGGHGDRLRSTFVMVSGTLRELFSAAQQAGQVRADVTPEQFVVFFVGLYMPPAMMSLRLPEVIDFDTQIEANWKLFLRAVAPDSGDVHG